MAGAYRGPSPMKDKEHHASSLADRSRGSTVLRGSRCQRRFAIRARRGCCYRIRLLRRRATRRWDEFASAGIIGYGTTASKIRFPPLSEVVRKTTPWRHMAAEVREANRGRASSQPLQPIQDSFLEAGQVGLWCGGCG